VFEGREVICFPLSCLKELVVYMTKDVPSADGFDIVARLGNVLQEM